MSSINKVTLIGRIGSEPETFGGSGFEKTSFSLATSEKYKDKNGEKQEKTEWHNIIVWNKLSSIISKFIKKGSLLYIEGKIQTKKFEHNGITKYKTEILAQQIQVLDNKNV